MSTSCLGLGQDVKLIPGRPWGRGMSAFFLPQDTCSYIFNSEAGLEMSKLMGT